MTAEAPASDTRKELPLFLPAWMMKAAASICARDGRSAMNYLEVSWHMDSSCPDPAIRVAGTDGRCMLVVDVRPCYPTDGLFPKFASLYLSRDDMSFVRGRDLVEWSGDDIRVARRVGVDKPAYVRKCRIFPDGSAISFPKVQSIIETAPIGWSSEFVGEFYGNPILLHGGIKALASLAKECRLNGRNFAGVKWSAATANERPIMGRMNMRGMTFKLSCGTVLAVDATARFFLMPLRE